jgi:hypothetical protein
MEGILYFLPNSVAEPEKMAGLTRLACYFLYLRRLVSRSFSEG